MKYIINNTFLKEFRFSSSQEVSDFLSNQKNVNVLTLTDGFGSNHYCYVSYHSLNENAQFIISFSTDEKDSNLNTLFWSDEKTLVVDVGNNLFFIKENLEIEGPLEITTPLIGLYLIDKHRLLVLEEAFVRIVDSNSRVLKKALFNLIENFNIEDSQLIVFTEDGQEVFEFD
jgi:hypothetical protein